MRADEQANTETQLAGADLAAVGPPAGQISYGPLYLICGQVPSVSCRDCGEGFLIGSRCVLDSGKVSSMKYISFEAVAFLEGVIELSAEERGFYITLIALNYARAKQNGSDQWMVGDVTDDLICKAMACRPQTWRRVKTALILKGKVHETGGKLRANRVQTEVSRVGFRAQGKQNQRVTDAGREGKEEVLPLKGNTSSDGKGNATASARASLDATHAPPPQSEKKSGFTLGMTYEEIRARCLEIQNGQQSGRNADDPQRRGNTDNNHEKRQDAQN